MLQYCTNIVEFDLQSQTVSELNVHAVVVRLIADSEDGSHTGQSFCRRFHRDRTCIHVCCLLLMAEEFEEETRINVRKVTGQKMNVRSPTWD